MEYIVGITLALFFCAAAAKLGLDRERAFYPAVAMAVARAESLWEIPVVGRLFRRTGSRRRHV